MKKMVSFMLIMVLGFLLAACGGNGTGNTPEKSGQTEKKAAESPAAENSDTEEQTADTGKEEETKSGKQVYLFCSHGTGGLAGSVKDISAAIPDAKISDKVFDVYEEDAASAKDEIVEWTKSTFTE